MSSAMALHKSVELVPNFFVIKILLHPSASSPDGPAPPLVLTVTLFTKSASIASNFIECTRSGETLILYSVDVFALTGSRLFGLIGGSGSLCYQSIASIAFGDISRVNFLEISVTVDSVFDGLKSFRVVSPLCSKSRISFDVHKSMRHSSAFKCPLHFDF